MLQGIETIFDDLEQMLHHLKKKSYEANTEVFVRENGFYFEEMKEYVEACLLYTSGQYGVSRSGTGNPCPDGKDSGAGSGFREQADHERESVRR